MCNLRSHSTFWHAARVSFRVGNLQAHTDQPDVIVSSSMAINYLWVTRYPYQKPPTRDSVSSGVGGLVMGVSSKSTTNCSFSPCSNAWWIWHIFISPRSHCKKVHQKQWALTYHNKIQQRAHLNGPHCFIAVRRMTQIDTKAVPLRWIFHFSPRRDRFSCAQDRPQFFSSMFRQQREDLISTSWWRDEAVWSMTSFFQCGDTEANELHNYIDVRKPHCTGASVIASVLRRFYGPSRSNSEEEERNLPFASDASIFLVHFGPASFKTDIPDCCFSKGKNSSGVKRLVTYNSHKAEQKWQHIPQTHTEPLAC